MMLLATNTACLIVLVAAVEMALVVAAGGATTTADISLIMCADEGTYSGVSETKYIVEKLTNLKNVSGHFPFCSSAIEGYLYGQPVAVLTTGIGHDHSAMCMVNALTNFGGKIREVLYMGTSGWTPIPDGVLTPDCKRTQRTDINQPGDLCVSAASTNWACHFAPWTPQLNASACHRPNVYGHDRSDIFGQCSFAGSTLLAEEVQEAARDASSPVSWPVMSAALQILTNRYWTAMGGPDPTVRHAPRILGPSQCLEASSYALWSGVPGDILCREYTRNVIQGSDAVTCVAAMEAVGWMEAIARAPAHFRPPFANIRGLSNYDHQALVEKPDGIWAEVQWGSSEEEETFTKLGYAHAIKTSNTIVLKLFEKRMRQSRSD
eukprot:NODE_1931_length_1353_cov_37.301380_g1749_i0.p1 GENE.NODE_1931_length_1353_cov_37.301380_g1749_i0~~NODE_1931_length_1353_cov_37.301380_g1749_i0.p1  ORF type:complete len:378 (+),score=62.85 NODE_1931_length_1353_cov_37.301380_g1749_i0:87-1220(+)